MENSSKRFDYLTVWTENAANSVVVPQRPFDLDERNLAFDVSPFRGRPYRACLFPEKSEDGANSRRLPFWSCIARTSNKRGDSSGFERRRLKCQKNSDTLHYLIDIGGGICLLIWSRSRPS